MELENKYIYNLKDIALLFLVPGYFWSKYDFLRIIQQKTLSLSFKMLYFKVPHTLAAVMLPESGGTVMILDILPHCKIMGPLIWPDFYFFGIFIHGNSHI